MTVSHMESSVEDRDCQILSGYHRKNQALKCFSYVHEQAGKAFDPRLPRSSSPTSRLEHPPPPLSALKGLLLSDAKKTTFDRSLRSL
jgi:hypothetical protein